MYITTNFLLQLQEFFQGLVGGVIIVGLVHSISILLGFATYRTGLPSSFSGPLDLIKSSSNVFILALRGFTTATSIAVVEEMVFRSWLPEEIAVDLGYYNAILISGLVFSLIHRYANSFSLSPVTALLICWRGPCHCW
jgi:membrane protease YdiL (CAAX protease family)